MSKRVPANAHDLYVTTPLYARVNDGSQWVSVGFERDLNIIAADSRVTCAATAPPETTVIGRPIRLDSCLANNQT